MVENVFLRNFDPIQICSTVLDLQYQPITFSGKVSLNIKSSNELSKTLVFSQDRKTLPTLRADTTINLKLGSSNTINVFSPDCFLHGQTQIDIQLVDPLSVQKADFLDDGSLALYLMNPLPENVFKQLSFQLTGQKGILTLTPTHILIRRLVQVSPNEIRVFDALEQLEQLNHILISLDGNTALSQPFKPIQKLVPTDPSKFFRPLTLIEQVVEFYEAKGTRSYSPPYKPIEKSVTPSKDVLKDSGGTPEEAELVKRMLLAF